MNRRFMIGQAYSFCLDTRGITLPAESRTALKGTARRIPQPASAIFRFQPGASAPGILSALIGVIFCFCLIFPASPAWAQKAEPVPDAASQPPASQGVTPGQPPEAVPMTDIHDIKPPEPAGPGMSLLYIVLGAVIVAALIALAVILWRKRRRRVKGGPAVPSLTPEEAALLSLSGLNDVDRIPGKDFYFRLSAILRHYLQGRYGVNAPEMTTDELSPKLDKMGIERDLSARLKALFHEADPIKFADALTVQTAMQSDLAFARKFVRETTPVTGAAEKKTDEQEAEFENKIGK